VKETTFTTKIKLPSYLRYVARVLIKEGFEAYLVGGAIRDIIIGREPGDYEIATNAKPEEVLESFPKAVSTGIRFGTVVVLSPDNEGENVPVEVTTFRSEEKYTDGRWPSEVKFESSINKDLGRRDFTINAFAVDLSQNGLSNLSRKISLEDEGKEWEVVDLFDGRKDIEDKIIRAVGDPVERFTEDGLRAFRACRFASVLQFDIEEETDRAIEKTHAVSELVSMERIRDEFIKMLMQSPKPSKGIELMRKNGLLKIFIPELLETVGVEQKLGHKFDVYTHILRTVDVAEDRVKLPALFHDIAKPETDMGDGHFYKHDTQSAKIAEKVMKRMKFPNKEIDRVKTLVREHMFYYPYKDDEEGSESPDFQTWSDAAVRRFIKRVGEEYIDDLFALRIADATSNPNTMFDPKEIEELQKHISKVRQEDMALKVEDLAVDGNDLMEIGFKPGPKMGRVLNELLDIVIEDPKLNTKKYLLRKAREMVGD
jgi:poly(A) polymerase/tRNA nucleotidyltransferase (CCA-adding enzyme)